MKTAREGEAEEGEAEGGGAAEALWVLGKMKPTNTNEFRDSTDARQPCWPIACFSWRGPHRAERTQMRGAGGVPPKLYAFLLVCRAEPSGRGHHIRNAGIRIRLG